MAVWTYSGYESETTVAAQLAMAKLYKKELLDAMTAPQSVGSDGHSMAKYDFPTLLATVNADILKYERKVGVSSSTIMPIRKTRP